MNKQKKNNNNKKKSNVFSEVTAAQRVEKAALSDNGARVSGMTAKPKKKKVQQKDLSGKPEPVHVTAYHSAVTH